LSLRFAIAQPHRDFAVQNPNFYGASVTFTGTGIPGQTVNTAVVFDFSKYMNRIHELNPEHRWARIEPGIVPDDLSHAANVYGLTFGPDPATHNRNTIGGMIGNNSCGIHSVMAGETADNVEELDVLTLRRRSHDGRSDERH
jgi:FAD/FMN-containing dehydrogenase